MKKRLSYSGWILAVKYWIQGDDWKFAKEYALSITAPFKR